LSVDAIGLKVPTFQRYFSHVSEASSLPAWDKTSLNHPVVPDHIVVNQKFVEFLRRLKLHQLKSGVVGFRELVRVNVREPAHWVLSTVVDARNGRFIIVAPLVLLRLALPELPRVRIQAGLFNQPHGYLPLTPTWREWPPRARSPVLHLDP